MYKPTKPDIDLIRDFNANHRKNSTPILKRTDSSGPLGGHSSLSAGCSSGTNPSSGYYGRRNSSYAAFPSCASSAIPEQGITATTINLESCGNYGNDDEDIDAGKENIYFSGEKTNSYYEHNGSKIGGKGKKGMSRRVRLRIVRNPGAPCDQYQIVSVCNNKISIGIFSLCNNVWSISFC